MNLWTKLVLCIDSSMSKPLDVTQGNYEFAMHSLAMQSVFSKVIPAYSVSPPPAPGKGGPGKGGKGHVIPAKAPVKAKVAYKTPQPPKPATTSPPKPKTTSPPKPTTSPPKPKLKILPSKSKAASALLIAKSGRHGHEFGAVSVRCKNLRFLDRPKPGVTTPKAPLAVLALLLKTQKR